MLLKLKKPKMDDFSVSETEHMEMYGHYYEPGVLSVEAHWQLVPQIKMLAEQAGIPEYYIYHTAQKILIAEEIDYVANWRSLPAKAFAGAVFLKSDENYIEKMHCIVGLMLRNYMDARYITLQDLVERLKLHEPITSRLFCIPNFAMAEGSEIARWERSDVISFLLNCHANGVQVIVGADNKLQIEKQYGSVIATHVSNHFLEF